MALAATRKQVHDAIVTAIAAISGAGKVYNRVRRPLHDNEAQIQALFNDSNSILNTVFVRWTGQVIESTSFDDTVAFLYPFEIEYRYAWNERDDDDNPSELIFNAFIDAMTATFRADKNIGFGDVGVSTKGLELLRPIERDPQDFYGKLCHTAYPRLVVSVAEC